jgi:hypothetical protein
MGRDLFLLASGHIHQFEVSRGYGEEMMPIGC